MQTQSERAARCFHSANPSAVLILKLNSAWNVIIEPQEQERSGGACCLGGRLLFWLMQGTGPGPVTSCWAGSSGVVERGSRSLKAAAQTLDVNPPSSSAKQTTFPTSLRKFGGKYLASDTMGSTMGQAYS